MSGKPVNLRQARKARARAQKRAEADANAARHGQTVAERTARRLERARSKRALDAARRDDREDD